MFEPAEKSKHDEKSKRRSKRKLIIGALLLSAIVFIGAVWLLMSTVLCNCATQPGIELTITAWAVESASATQTADAARK